MKTRIGRPHPLGATQDGDGINFAVVAPDASALELCLFDGRPTDEGERRLRMYRGAEGVWHLQVEGLGHGQAYGFRAHGPWDPVAGHLFNPSKLLVDPRSRAIRGEMTWSAALVAGTNKRSGLGAGPCPVDSAAFCPRSVVVETATDRTSDRRPRVPWSETVIYEAHVRGLTLRHPELPEAQRGRYSGLAHPAIVDHLLELGVTTLELMPVQQFVTERHLQQRRMVNYWGYNPIAPMAPHGGYAGDAAGGQVGEFREMVLGLHEAGLEVVLDLVFNHTAEGDLAGPTLSLRGLANARCYRRREDGSYLNFSGCGNTLDLRSPMVLQLVLDSLRYWASEMRIDGFRLDLAPILARQSPDFDPAAPLFEAISADPELSTLKWIAEPWDVGPDGYQLGAFPPPFAEWNDRFRDTARSVWRGEEGRTAELTARMAGSADIFGEQRGATASVNYVTAHDGFTLADLTSYDERRNHANGERNLDGHRHPLSRSWGVEGPTEDRRVRSARDRARRNLVATLALADGVPMLLHGDEMLRTQGGNNNAYCQDNETTWVDWSTGGRSDTFLAFAGRALALRARWRRQHGSGDPRRAIGWRPLAADPSAPGAPAETGGCGWVDVEPATGEGLLALTCGPSSAGARRPLLLIQTREDRPHRFRLAAGEGSRKVALATFEAPAEVEGEIELPPLSLLALEPADRTRTG